MYAADGAGHSAWEDMKRPPPHLYFLVSAVFHYLGPAFAVLLFARVDVLGVAWLRIASAALVFAAWRRPWRAFAAQDREGRRLLVAWGAVLAVMNVCFYTAIDRLALGTVAAIEFLPIIVLAALGARTTRNLAALALAVPGVYLLTDVGFAVQPLGLAFAFANAALFALYVVLADRVAKRDAIGGIDGLAASMLIAAVVVTPMGGGQAMGAFADPVALLAGIGVGVASSVIPYVCDQLALRRLPRATYALLVCLLPATATVIGIAVLAQIPTRAETAGLLLVVAGVALHREPVTPRPDPRAGPPAATPTRARSTAPAAASR
jgi:inner membrane transporter RhtA